MRTAHPGQVLKDEIDEVGISLSEFARQIDVPANRISQIIAGKRAISGDSALRFGHWFGTDPAFWMTLQAQHELAAADQAVGNAVRKLTNKDAMPKKVEQPRLV